MRALGPRLKLALAQRGEAWLARVRAGTIPFDRSREALGRRGGAKCLGDRRALESRSLYSARHETNGVIDMQGGVVVGSEGLFGRFWH